MRLLVRYFYFRYQYGRVSGGAVDLWSILSTHNIVVQALSLHWQPPPRLNLLLRIFQQLFLGSTDVPNALETLPEIMPVTQLSFAAQHMFVVQNELANIIPAIPGPINRSKVCARRRLFYISMSVGRAISRG